MKSRPIGTDQDILSSHQNDKRDDARGGSFLLPHQQLGALALGTAPTNGQTVSFVINGTTITAKAVASVASANDIYNPGTALGFATNLLNWLRRPDLTNSNQIAASGANQTLLSYVGWAWPGSSTTIVPFSLNKNVNGITGGLTSFNITTTVTSGSWTAQTMQLYVEDGTYYIAGTRYLFTGGSTPTVTAPVSHPRIDVLTINSSGTLAWTTGTESSSPSAPAYPTGVIPICELYNVVSETALYDNENQQSGEGYVYNDVRPAIINPFGQFILDPGSEAQGDVLYYNGSAWTLLAPGTAGNVLTTGGASANPSWSPAGGKFAKGTASGTDYTITSTSGNGAAIDATNLSITVAGAVGQIVRITVYGWLHATFTVNSSVFLNLVDTTNSVLVGTAVSLGAGGVTGTALDQYGAAVFYYPLASASTTFQLYGLMQQSSTTAVLKNPATASTQSFAWTYNGHTSTQSETFTSNGSSYAWFTISLF